MAITSILAAGQGAATSAEYVIDAGTSARVGIRSYVSGQQLAVMILVKSDDGTFYPRTLLSQERPSETIPGPATIVVNRITGYAGAYIETTSAATQPAQTPWSYAAAPGGIVNTSTAVTIKGASGAGVRNYITSLQILATALGLATEVVVRDGAGGTVLWRGTLTTAGALAGVTAKFDTPLAGTANTLLEVATLTPTLTGAVFVNAQGYSA